MVDENQGPARAEAKVRRSIFISEELESALARLAEERGTTTNDLISQILSEAVVSLLEAAPASGAEDTG
jgi:hypothetical protein